jgi:hypothetical protein
MIDLRLETQNLISMAYEMHTPKEALLPQRSEIPEWQPNNQKAKGWYYETSCLTSGHGVIKT